MRALAISVFGRSAAGINACAQEMAFNDRDWTAAPASALAKERSGLASTDDKASLLRFIEFSRERGRSRRLTIARSSDVRRYALRRPAACQEYCAAGLRGLKTGRWRLKIDTRQFHFTALSFQADRILAITLLPPRW